ncbi:MAG: helix-turn-helix domain-containing protein [Bacteroidetes bacterium]|nr:helix-turn-helix domain-containing protein [Bacteroidota bacterium]
MNVITIEDEAFYELYAKLVSEIRHQLHVLPRDKWIDGDEAMQILRIKSKTTLQKFRDEGKIRFSQPEPRIILYDRDSIDAFIEKHAKDTF